MSDKRKVSTDALDIKSMSDIFDLNNLNDLPDDVKKQIAPLGLKKDTEMFISLFDIKEQLTVDEIIVGMMRKYNSWTVYNLKCRKIIKEVDDKKKTYEKVRKG
jgi:hypothetical protein